MPHVPLKFARELHAARWYVTHSWQFKCLDVM
jgi:hypothetical protein